MTKRYWFRRRTCFRSLGKDCVFHATHVSTRIFNVRARIFRMRENWGDYNSSVVGAGTNMYL